MDHIQILKRLLVLSTIRRKAGAKDSTEEQERRNNTEEKIEI
jgi:hypothetical protein